MPVPPAGALSTQATWRLIAASVEPAVPNTTPPAFREAANAALRSALTRTEQSVKRLQLAAEWLTRAGDVLSIASGFIPIAGLSEAVQAVVRMLNSAQHIITAKAAALKLIGTCAIILTAVTETVKHSRQEMARPLRENILDFIDHINDTAKFLAHIASRSSFKQLLQGRDAEDIQQVHDDILRFYNIFFFQAHIHESVQLEGLKRELETQRAERSDMRAQLAEMRMQNDLILRFMMKVISTPMLMSNVFQPNSLDNSSLVAGTQESIYSLERIQSGRVSFEPLHNLPDVVRSATLLDDVPLVEDTLPSSSAAQELDADAISQRFVETGLAVNVVRWDWDCELSSMQSLRRGTAEIEPRLPDWTISADEIEPRNIIVMTTWSVIYFGKWLAKDVAIKQFYLDKDRQSFVTEVELWRSVQSEYIVDFLGASSCTGPAPWTMISPWMVHGDIINYLRASTGGKARSGYVPNRSLLVYRIALGMRHLHSKSVIHGDLRGCNILIDDQGNPRLAHFRLSVTMGDIDRDQANEATRHRQPYLPPERLRGGRPSIKSDVFAFAFTVIEIYSVGQRFKYPHEKELTNEWGRFFSQRRSFSQLMGPDTIKPLRPNAMDDPLWRMVKRCWADEPADRPDFVQICAELRTMCDEQGLL